ncbi:MAG: polysaccharide biosynthesis tyrosine autokinase [Thermodesulfobacteriota bacterium]|nr:polysaccharide biosynthesis tyrosine autokinase [Thermodesulfobacteriota bacterium]
MEKTGQEQVDLRDYLRVIMKRRWTIITVLAVIVVTVTIHAFTATPVYEATARLIIDKENPNVVSIQEVMAIDASGMDYYQTQYKIIESRTVAREVIRRLNLEESEEFSPKPKAGLISTLSRSIRETFGFWTDSIAYLLKTEEKAISEASSEYEEDSALVSEFIDRIDVEPIRNSRLVDVSFQAKDPSLAARIANTLARAYIDQNLETRLMAIQDAVKWLHSRIEEERKRVEKAEHALLRYKERHNIVTDFSSDVENITAQKLAQLNAQVVEAESKRVEAETRYSQAMALVGTPDMLDSIPEVLNNELIMQIKSMEVELYKRVSELSKKYGQRHPQMVAIRSELETLQKRKIQEVNQVVNSLRNEHMVALARENSFKAALGKQKRESLDLNQKAVEYGVLRREAESARQMYELLINRFKETSLTEDMKTGNIRIVDRAEVAETPIKPRKKLHMLLALMVGLTTGIGLAFFFEYLDNTIKLPEDIERHLKIPYLGPVPAMAMEDHGSQSGENRPELVTLHSPKSTASEAYRGIRTSILFSSAENRPQVILVTSAGPQEGKTITTTNLSITMAQSGSKVIILDCDMRRPKIHKLFGLSRDKGLSNVLVNGCGLKDAVVHTEITNLDIIPCGPIPPNPSEILGSSLMSKLLKVLEQDYERVVIDSPPITAVTDAVVLAKFADGIILVVREGETPREIIKNGLGQLQAVNGHVLGVVLNGIDIGRDNYYYYQYYYYYYGDDGEKGKRPQRNKRPKSHYEDA